LRFSGAGSGMRAMLADARECGQARAYAAAAVTRSSQAMPVL
jgi:hypothetical protein